MRIIRPPEALAGPPAGDPGAFTGPVGMQPVHATTEPSTTRVAVVHFRDGATTNWHVHSAGQVLHVVQGRGEVQAWGGPVESIAPGDTVSAEPGEKHWHGAEANSDMAHLAVSFGETSWMEPPERR